MQKVEKKTQNFNAEINQNRINYLYQLSTALSTECPGLSSAYNCILKGLAQKNLLKIDPTIKRNICKGCNAMLIPGKSAKCRLIKKPKKLVKWTCIFCGTSKTYGRDKTYYTWSECSDFLLQTINYN